MLRRWMAGDFGFVVSPRLLHELQTVLARAKFRRHFAYEEATGYVSWLHREAQVVRDPTTSTSSGSWGRSKASPTWCPWIAHLLDLPDGVIKGDKGAVLARVLTPREFLRELGQAGYDLASPANSQERGKTDLLPSKRHARAQVYGCDQRPQFGPRAASRAGPGFREGA